MGGQHPGGCKRRCMLESEEENSWGGVVSGHWKEMVVDFW
jgi:hypothetical protein